MTPTLVMFAHRGRWLWRIPLIGRPYQFVMTKPIETVGPDDYALMDEFKAHGWCIHLERA